MEKILNRNAVALCLSAMSLFAVGAYAGTYGTLERVGNSYKVTATVSEKSTGASPFIRSNSADRNGWNFGWNDLQPGFFAARFECRNPNRPLNCNDDKDRDVQLCSAFENQENDFVKLALTKSGYGNTPHERSVPSEWSQKSAGDKAKTAVGTAIVAGVFAPMATVILGPVFAIDAMMRPQCLGWRTKWVEFDHEEFNRKVNAGLLANGLEKPEARALIQERFETYLQARNAMAREESSKLTSELQATLAKATPFEKLIAQVPRNTLPKNYTKFIPTFEDWKPEVPATDILADYEPLLQTNSQQISAHYANQREVVMTAANAHLVRVTEVAAEVSKTRFDAADTAQAMQALRDDLQNLADPAGLLPQVNDRLPKLQQAENTKRLLLEKQRAEQEKQRAEQARKDAALQRENERKAEIAVIAFRKSLKVGVDTNCGPVVELRPPMAKIAVAVKDYGTEHWLKISTIWPPGAGCSFYNGGYVPPR